MASFRRPMRRTCSLVPISDTCSRRWKLVRRGGVGLYVVWGRCSHEFSKLSCTVILCPFIKRYSFPSFLFNISVWNLAINKSNIYNAPEVALCMLKNVYRSQVERCPAETFETAIVYLRCVTDTVCLQLWHWLLFFASMFQNALDQRTTVSAHT